MLIHLVHKIIFEIPHLFDIGGIAAIVVSVFAGLPVP